MPGLEIGATIPSVPGTQLDAHLGDLSRVSRAIAEGTLRITFVGDSILEGKSHITYQDSPAGVWMRLLQEQNPTLNLVFSNFSILGQGLYQLRHPGFVGGHFNVPGVSFAQRESCQAERRWPGGTVIGKSWWDHVKDSNPDLLIFGFGMNHVVMGDWAYSPTTVTNAVFYREMNERLALWPNPPSVAAIPSMLPTHRTDIDGGIWPRFRMMVQQEADTVRGICRELNWTCIDVNRWWSIAADARDPVLMHHDHHLQLMDYAENWTMVSGGWTVTGRNSIRGSGILRSMEMCSDLYQRFHFAAPNIADCNPGMFWRDRGDLVQGQPNRYSMNLVRASDGAVQLLVIWQNQTLATVNLGAAKRHYVLEVLVEGARHRAYVDNVLVADLSHMGNMGEGYNGVFLSRGRCRLFNSAVSQGRPAVVGEVEYSDDDLLGIDDWLKNAKSLGGGLRNHPSRLGVQVAFLPAFVPLARAINHLATFGSGAVTRTLHDNTSDFWTGLSNCSLVIDEQVQHPAFPLVFGTALLLTTSASTTVRLAAAREVPVYLSWNASRKELAMSLTLGAGTWVITATAQLNRAGDEGPSSGYHGQTLTVTAVRG
ncbi:MAG TPA: hypothetical protein DIT18_08540 [Pseudomonas sp.]|nr:hypothetical protein [Pseudomonas sp.]